MADETREEWLQERQDGRVYPVGRVLRDTYHADNHDSLGSDVTGLMIDLSRVPYGAAAAPAADPHPDRASDSDRDSRPFASRVRPSILARLGGLLGRR